MIFGLGMAIVSALILWWGIWWANKPPPNGKKVGLSFLVLDQEKWVEEASV